MKLTQAGPGECVQCTLVWARVFVQVVGMRSKRPRGKGKSSYWTAVVCFSIGCPREKISTSIERARFKIVF